MTITAESFAVTATTCLHCGRDSSNGEFCCSGCETVYRIIHHQPARAVKASEKTYAELDDPIFFEKHTQAMQDGLRQIELYLEGVHCSSCVWLLEKDGLEGLIRTRVDLGRQLADVCWDPSKVSLSKIAQRFDRLGYPPHPTTGKERRELQRKEDRALLLRIAVAGAAFGNVMLMAFALYGGLFQGMERTFEELFRWASLLVTAPAFFWPGSVFWRGAIRAIRERTPHMDLPIALGLTIGFLSGAVNTIRGSGEIYFDSVAAVIFLLLVGRWLQRRQQRAAAEAAELRYSLVPRSARLIEEGRVREVPIEAVAKGALLEVRAGEHVPADGVVIEGCSSVDSSLLSGEARPISVEVGSKIHAGTINLGSRLLVRADEIGAATRFGKILSMVEDAAKRRAPIVLAADRYSAIFVRVVLAIAAVSAGVWWFIDPSRIVDNTVALLVVTCPCALGLATPLAVSAAIARASKLGILIKGGDAIERLAGTAKIIFDKTGTLTEGRQRLVEWRGDLSLRSWVAAIEASSAHPIARAFTAAFASLEAPAIAPIEVRHTIGSGVEAKMGRHRLRIGSVSFVTGGGASLPAWADSAWKAWSSAGHTTVLVSIDGVILAAAAIGDAIREDAKKSLSALRRLGFELGVLSGDDASVVAHVASRVGVPASVTRGGASPEEKLAEIDRAASRGPVIMIGDGVNDAAALSRADVGIAVHGGAEASLAAADVFLDRPGVAPVVLLVEGARRTMRVIKRNMRFSLLYNLTGMSLAVLGLMDPLVAALLMPLSSLTVVASSYRSRTFGGR
jgi:P-type Cu2+ transporter